MSHIAFYAPLKSPDHPTPSGDRQIARNLMTALERGLARPVVLSSTLRSREAQGSACEQETIRSAARAEIDRIVSAPARPAIWVSYHNYYKAPDLIGPHVAAQFGIPYVLIEASRAKSRLTGPWARFALAAERACDAADVIFHFTEQDRFAVDRDRVAGQQIVELPPFLCRDDLPAVSALDGPMLAVGMMRHKDKLASYALIARAVALMTASDWRLDIVGDGAARGEVETMFARFGARVRFLGALQDEALQQAYSAASLFVWPGVNEAFGMVYLEAQAAGLPVVAQDRPGVRDVLGPGIYPDPAEGAAALAAQMDALLLHRSLRHCHGAAARRHVANRHLLPAAAQTLKTTLRPMIGDHP